MAHCARRTAHFCRRVLNFSVNGVPSGRETCAILTGFGSRGAGRQAALYGRLSGIGRHMVTCRCCTDTLKRCARDRVADAVALHRRGRS